MQTKKFMPLALLALSMVSWAGTQDAMGNSIDNWAWNYRPLIVVAPNSQVQQLDEQRTQLLRLRDEMRERDMAFIEIVGGRAHTVIGPEANINVSALMKHLNVRGDRFEVILLGKDTSVKLRSEKAVEAKDVFALIDSMPMRLREMRQGRQSLQ